MEIRKGPGEGEPGFDDPLALMAACHRRVERFLAAQIEIAEHYRGAEMNASDCGRMRSALAYFTEAAPRHTQDEELSLFPKLQLRAGPELLALANELHAQHRRADPLHEAVNRATEDWLADGTLPGAAADQLLANLLELQALYAGHIAREDAELFPGARACLHHVDLEIIGREVAARRGVDFDRWRATKALLAHS